ncbi:MAG: cupin domain-containing protein [Candidatus Levybacteria bacterium]|nr:cupin domain-containing protein [Candidatus Levybacteria bacterium]
MLIKDLKEEAKENNNFRKVLMTGTNSQVVIMSIPVGGDIGEEVHPNIDQFFYFVKGDGEAVLDGETTQFEKHDAVFVRAGTMHNIKNTGDEDLKLFTVYAPPAHPDGTIHRTKEEAAE